ncbi:MAG: hypothetical protein B1H04_03005 [Planctomycetales bacterium 4484_123]|nr:MAG: hypothetical protein B1H04_03005 [Planctomycetales bacterium 4484_123]
MAGMRYPGSALLVFRLLGRRGVGRRLELWERDPAAHADLAGHFRPWPEVAVHLGDGYEGVASLEGPSLVLVDPPGVDAAERRRIVALLGLLCSKGVPFICWTARLSGASGEAEDSRRMHEAACALGCRAVRVSWPRRGGRTIGCQLTVPPGVHGATAETVGQVCRVMGWTVEEP